MAGGVPSVCAPDPETGGCQRAYVNHADVQAGGPHAGRVSTAGCRRWRHGRLRRCRRTRTKPVPRCDEPELRACADGRDGLPHAERHPELLELRAELCLARPHVRAQRVVEPARAPVRGIRVGGDMHGSQRPEQLPERHLRATTLAAEWDRVDVATLGVAEHTDIRVDRHDIPAPQEQCLVGLLRNDGHRTRLPERRCAELCAGEAISIGIRHLESVAVLRHCRERQAGGQHPVVVEFLFGCKERHIAGRVVGCAVGR